MDVNRYWEIPLRTVAGFGERLLEPLERLPYGVRRALTGAFWGYHVLFLVVLVLDGRLWHLDKQVVFFAFLPLLVLWGVFFAYFLIVHLPINGLYSLYSYLRDKQLPPSHAILISVFTLIGVLATIFFLIFTGAWFEK